METFNTTNTLKNAEQWAVQILKSAEDHGGFDSEQDLAPLVKAIQKDAIFHVAKLLRSDGPVSLGSYRAAEIADNAAEKL